jgi:hypothetical protein
MALHGTRVVQQLSSTAPRVDIYSRPSTIGLLTLGTKQTGKPSARNSHAGFDVAGTGDRLTDRLVRHFRGNGKQQIRRPYEALRQFSTLRVRAWRCNSSGLLDRLARA